MDNISLSTILFFIFFIFLSSVISVINRNKPYIKIDKNWLFPSSHELQLTALNYNEKSKNNLHFKDFEDCYKLDAAIYNYDKSVKCYEAVKDHTTIRCYYSYLFLVISWLIADKNKPQYLILLIMFAIAIVVSVISYKLIERFYKGNFNYVEITWNNESNTLLIPADYPDCRSYFKAEKERCLDRLEMRAKVYNDAAKYMEFAHSKKILLTGLAFSLIYLLSNFVFA